MERENLKSLVTKMPKETTVLVADDSFLSRQLIVRLLKKMGFQVVEAANGKEAWEYFQNSNKDISLVILDWVMPEMDGLEVCRLIRKVNVGCYVYIIFLSSVEKKEDIALCLESGADDYIIKPVHEKEFLARITVGLRILALERALQETNRRLKNLAITDELTGLLNRRALFAELKKNTCRFIREEKPFHIIMLDIDHFKKINDSYGHQAGDKVLQELAKRLENELRPYDLIGRYGGEEFLIAIGNISKQNAMKLAERIRKSIADQPFFITRDYSIPVTASLGIASLALPVHQVTDREFMKIIYDLIKRADKALYQAKQEGRNQIVFFDEPAKTK
jgi:diguanylate cyclase (GGDEF)-like protein